MTFNWKPSTAHDGHYFSLESAEPPCEITIEPRPSYCDRGRWIAKLHPTGDLAWEIDHADGWPRYYFDLGVAMRECEAWLTFRAQSRTRKKR